MSISLKPKTVVLCEMHSDVLNRFVQQKIVSYLKIKGYTNFFLEGEEATLEATPPSKNLRDKDQEINTCLAREFNSPFFHETYPADKCVSRQYFGEINYATSVVLLNLIRADGFMLQGFDINKIAYIWSDVIDATEGMQRTI